MAKTTNPVLSLIGAGAIIGLGLIFVIRHLRQSTSEETRERELDEALGETFPASDPINSY
jgi:hypothetical protein